MPYLGLGFSLLETYEYAELGEAAGLVNMPDEAPEGRGMDGERQRLLQRSRVLENCVSELEARQSAEPKKRRNAHRSTGEPNTSLEVRSLNQDVSLREAGQHMQKWKGTHDEGTGQPHLTVTQDGAFIGVISVSNILRYYSGVV